MVGHRCNRTFPEWPESAWGCVYFGGVQSDTCCSGKRRAHTVFIWKEWGLFFHRHVGAGNWKACSLGGPCRCWPDRPALGTHGFGRVGPVAFVSEMLLYSISLPQPVGLAAHFSTQHKGHEVKDCARFSAGPFTTGNPTPSDSSDRESAGSGLLRMCIQVIEYVFHTDSFVYWSVGFPTM